MTFPVEVKGQGQMSNMLRKITIFHRLTESLKCIVEKWDENQNVQPDVPFRKYATDLSYDFRFLRYGPIYLNVSKRVIENSENK